MRTVLHIGMEKTATTSIQKTLASHRTELASEGILYPKFKTNSNVEVYNYAKGISNLDELRVFNGIRNANDLNSFRKYFEEDLTKQLEFDVKTMVLSNENLSSRLFDINELRRLRGFLTELSTEVTVVVYVRNLYSFILSSYSTAVKQGETVELYEFIGRDKLKYRFQYEKILNLWRNVFGQDNVIVKNYDDVCVGEGLVSDFFSFIGSSVELKEIDSIKHNKSLDYVALTVLKRLNKNIPFIKDNKYNSLRGDLVNILEKVSINERPMFEAEELSMIDGTLSKYSEEIGISNSLTQYQKGLFTKPECTNHSEISAEDVINIFSDVWTRKQAQHIKGEV